MCLGIRPVLVNMISDKLIDGTSSDLVHLELGMKRLDFGGQRSWVTVTSWRPIPVKTPYLRNALREFLHIWKRQPLGLENQLSGIQWSKVEFTVESQNTFLDITQQFRC